MQELLLCHLMARRLEEAKNIKINITMFSTSVLCLAHHWNILMSVRARESTRPTCPGVQAKQGRRGIKSVPFFFKFYFIKVQLIYLCYTAK